MYFVSYITDRALRFHGWEKNRTNNDYNSLCSFQQAVPPYPCIECVRLDGFIWYFRSLSTSLFHSFILWFPVWGEMVNHVVPHESCFLALLKTILFRNKLGALILRLLERKPKRIPPRSGYWSCILWFTNSFLDSIPNGFSFGPPTWLPYRHYWKRRFYVVPSFTRCKIMR